MEPKDIFSLYLYFKERPPTLATNMCLLSHGTAFPQRRFSGTILASGDSGSDVVMFDDVMHKPQSIIFPQFSSVYMYIGSCVYSIILFSYYTYMYMF